MEHMTLDELNVVISVSADEALEKLDALIEKARELGALYSGGMKLDVSAQGVLPAQEAMTALGDTVAQQAQRAEQSLSDGALSAAAFAQGLSGLSATADAGADALDGLGAALGAVDLRSAANEASDADTELVRAAKSADTLGSSARELERRWGAISAIRKNIKEFRELRSEYQRATADGRGVSDAFAKLQAAASHLGYDVDGSAESLDKCSRSVDALEKSVEMDASGMANALAAMLVQAQQTEAALNISAAMGVDVSQPLSAIQAVIVVINALLALMGQAGIKTSGRSGGGGGASRRAASVSQPARDDALQREYERIEHLRHMDKITLEQELALIRALRNQYQMNAEELMDWEERVYDLKQEIRQRNASDVDELAQGVKDALRAQYEAMRDAELARLDESRAAWEKWRDDSVSAIEDQISALDELASAEDREQKDAEELRKIQRLRQEIAFEQDAYNRAKLGQQLDAELKSREERLRKLELEDQKTALQRELEQAEDKAQRELDALDERERAINEAYEKRLADAAIEAEAERLLLKGNQQELLKLLADFAPEYDALGRTLGERLLNGFKTRVGDIAAWFKAFNRSLEQAQLSVANALAHNAPGENAAGVTINQQNTFNVPVETPGETARRVRLANEALADELLRTV